MVMSAELEDTNNSTEEYEDNIRQCAEYISEIIDNMLHQLNSKKTQC